MKPHGTRLVVLLLTGFAASCGYHTGGRADLIPKTVHTVAVPAFTNVTARYRLTDQLPQAISREFIARTRYRVVTDPETADAVLDGAVLGYNSFPTVFDPKTGRASAVELRVVMRLSLRERATGKVLYNRPNFEVRERYQISIDPAAFLKKAIPLWCVPANKPRGKLCRRSLKVFEQT